MSFNPSFQWERQPKAEQLVLAILEQAIQRNRDISILSDELLRQTSTRLFDWLDSVSVPPSDEIIQKLQEAGFIGEEQLYTHPGAQLPRVHLTKDDSVGISVCVDSIADFLMVRGENCPVEGSRLGNYRRCLYSNENGAALWIVERRGTSSVQPTEETLEEIALYAHSLEQWMTRSRPLFNEDQAMQATLDLTQRLIDTVGQHRAAWIILEGERRYWQARNEAGQIQKNRQDRLGMGWANHDHHTFRSSRKRFQQLVQLFERVGFHCRERFYAGEEAGWGAQVMENPVCRLVLFLDVDLSPHEVVEDFAHIPLQELDTLGTVGLWCALHGDSILKSGMHHLEAQFMFDELKEDLTQHGIKMMAPFSSFPHLKQAFTVGEMWPVDPMRVQHLIDEHKITPEQGAHFISHGALGSHLENLQRRDGFKGFNQKSVSQIIKRTDPRLQDNQS